MPALEFIPLPHLNLHMHCHCLTGSTPLHTHIHTYCMCVYAAGRVGHSDEAGEHQSSCLPNASFLLLALCSRKLRPSKTIFARAKVQTFVCDTDSVS
eukprot:349785-Chlamydomonas_euryale.AAC.15